MASQNTSTLISDIYKSRKTLIEQLKSQNYNTTDYQDFSINEVNTMKINEQLDMLLNKKDVKEGEHVKKIYVKYYLAKTLKPANIQEMIDDLFIVEEILKKEDTLLIVVKDEVNETMIQYIEHIWETDRIFIILIPLKRLQYNVLEHILVPKHRVLNEAEKISIKKKYNIMNDDEFPKLDRTEPVAKAIGIRPGEVCEIIRPSKTAIEGFYYRICN